MNIAVIFAGGSGTRMHSKDCPKQFLKIYNEPIIVHTLKHFQKHEEVDAIVIACISDWISYLQGLLFQYRLDKVKKVVPGGKSGQESIYNGLLAAKEVAEENGSAEDAVVLIHDGVRPMINQAVITDNIRAVKESGSAITTGLVTETILEIDPHINRILQVPERDNSRVAKAPQSFFLKDILHAHEIARAEGTSFIDSCTMMKHYGYKLTLVDGPNENIKITTPQDFYNMRAFLEAKENEQIYLPSTLMD